MQGDRGPTQTAAHGQARKAALAAMEVWEAATEQLAAAEAAAP